MGRNVVDVGFGAIKHFRLPPGSLKRENYYTLIQNTDNYMPNLLLHFSFSREGFKILGRSMSQFVVYRCDKHMNKRTLVWKEFISPYSLQSVHQGKPRQELEAGTTEEH